MSRRLTLLFSAFEALLVAAIGVAIPLLVATLLWAIQFGFAPDWALFWRGAVDVWLIGHGVDVRFTLDELTAVTIGAPAGTVVAVTMAALGFALLTLLLGVRAGTRVSETGHRMLGAVTAVLVFGVLSLLLTLSAVHVAARPSIWQGTLLPPVVFGVGLLLGMLRADAAHGPVLRGRVAEWMSSWDPRARAGAAAALRAGTASVAIVLLASAVAAAVVLVAGYAQAIRMYEALHAEVLGGVVLTVGQLAFVPNVVIWAASWFAGPGFALGAGSHVSPLGTAVGPLPAVPLLGALPSGELSFGFVGLAVPVVAAFVAAIAVRRSLVRALGDGPRLPWFALVAGGGAIWGGLLLGLLAHVSAGGLGPGRFGVLGPDAVAVGLAAALELLIGLALGLAAGGATGFGGRSRTRGRDSEPAAGATTPAT